MLQPQWMKARQTKYTAYVTLYILVIIAVLSAANWLANRHNKSFDATSNKRFSLSDQTIKIAKNLKQDVTITYFDKTSNFTSAKDLLDRYSNLSPKLRVDYVDPDKKPQIWPKRRAYAPMARFSCRWAPSGKKPRALTRRRDYRRAGPRA